MFDTIVPIGEVFVGIAVLILVSFVCWILYQINRILKSTADTECKYNLFEEMTLDQVALKKGVDLEKQLVKRNLFKKRTFRKEVEKEVLETMFGKEK